MGNEKSIHNLGWKLIWGKDHLQDLGKDGSKAKVKVPLCVTKHHTLKTYLLLS